MHVWLGPVAVHVCVVHDRQVFVTGGWTRVVGQTHRRDGGDELRRHGGRDGDGGRDGAVVQCGHVLRVDAVGTVVQLRKVHGGQTEAHGPGQELLSVHHVYCGERDRAGTSQADAISDVDSQWP